MPEPEDKKEEPTEETPEKQEPVKEEPKDKQETQETQTDWEKRYKDLQSTFNKRDNELKELSTLKEEVERYRQFDRLVTSDPEKFKTIKQWMGIKDENKEENKEEPNGKSTPSEAESFIRRNIVDRFEDKYGIKQLDADKKKALQDKIAGNLNLMLDSSGTGKPTEELIGQVPLERLPWYFENAYKLATAGDSEEQARLAGIAEAQTNNNGMIGSIPSSSANSKEVVLTDRQKEVAKKLEIAEKDYITYLNK